MRTTYVSVPMVAEEQEMGPAQTPTKIVMHRQGNPGTEGEAGADWGKRTGAFSIHRYIDDARVRVWIPLQRQAFHVKEGRNAATFGLPVTGRGDMNTVGIEMEDESPTSAPLMSGQAYGLSQETRTTAVILVADILKLFKNMTVADIIEHADLDPWTRAEDVGDGLYLPEFRLDVADFMAGKEPWRTVGKYADGKPTMYIAPAVAPPTPAPVVKTYEQGYAEGRTSGRFDGLAAARNALADLK